MLSRIADSLFWLNRYMERADGMLRIVKTNYVLSLDKGIITDDLKWNSIVEIFSITEKEKITSLEDDAQAAIQYLLFDEENNNSLKLIITRARENARGVQDHITKEMWEQINQMYHLINGPQFSKGMQNIGSLEIIDYLVRHTLLFTGVLETTMPRGLGWSFMCLGKYIERCLLTIELLNKNYVSIGYNLDTNRDIFQWKNLLLSLSGYELHLKQYRTSDYNRNILHQLLFNPDFTRSVTYSLRHIQKYFNDIISENNSTDHPNLERYFNRMISKVSYVDFETLNNYALQSFLTDVKEDMLNFSKRFAQIFFSNY